MKFWNWKSINKEEGKQERVLVLNGTIAEESWFDDDITPKVFRDELMSGSGNITVWINSPGGDCIAAAEIYNMLMDYKGDVIVKIDGIAASAASVIAMAGTKVMMSPVSMLMIHNPSTLASGDKQEMKKAIEMLESVKESIINAYEIKTGLDRNTISRLMDNETWMDVNKAMELKFCDELLLREDIENMKKIDNNIFYDDTPKMYEQKIAERNLQNKLESKYLIKKKEEPKGELISNLENRLIGIKKFI